MLNFGASKPRVRGGPGPPGPPPGSAPAFQNVDLELLKDGQIYQQKLKYRSKLLI